MATKKKKEPLWMEFFNAKAGNIGLCGLCGNTGRIDTRESAVSSVGVKAGIIAFCICPNGRAMKKALRSLQREEPRIISKGGDS